MPKIIKELGALEVARLKADGVYSVGGVAGLHLRVAGLSRSWVLRYVIHKTRRRMGLGSFPTVTLAMARELAREMHLKIRQGVDPLEERDQQRAQRQLELAKKLLFKEAARKCITAKSSEWSNAKHAGQWSATLETYAFPFIGDLDVTAITTQNILEVLEPIWHAKTETATRVRGRIETVLDWAAVFCGHQLPNPARWTGHLDQILPKPTKIAKVRHHEAVPYKEVAPVVRAIAESAGQGAKALLFQVLTATRSGEAREAVWSEIDMSAGIWVIPAERMKARREHRVPLSKQVLALLAGQARKEGCDYVFPSGSGKALSDMTLTAVMRRMELTAVPHGFRSTFRDWAAECTDYEKDVVEMALAHTIENKVEAAYRRGDLLEKRAQLMQDWADHCMA